MAVVPMCDTVVLYHRSCNDGIAAAWAAYQYLGEGALYAPYQYGDELPAIVQGRHLIMVDLSLPAEMLNLDELGVASLLIIDHHKTAQPLIAITDTVSNVDQYLKLREDGQRTFLYFDLAFSGAVLTWMFFAPADRAHAVPEALRMIQDYDLWKHELVGSRQFNAWLAAGDRSIERFNRGLRADGSVTAEVIASGHVLMEYDRRIAQSVAKLYVRPVKWKGMMVATVNAPAHLRNEVADILSAQYPVVVCYTVRDEEVVYSLRSSGEVDVSALAEQFDGGGHSKAAAFALTFDTAELKVLHWLRPALLQRLKKVFTWKRST